MHYITKTATILLGIICLSFGSLFSETVEKKGTLSSTKLVDIEIISLKGISRKKTAIVFRAETEEGEPAWDLKKEDLIVTEGGDTCEITSIEPVSKNKPICVSLVMDHSGSMDFALTLSNIVKLIRGQKDSIISPLEYAKTSANSFIATFNFEKDYISLIGFATKVDLKQPLTQDSAQLVSLINSLKTTGSTALYDAMIAAQKQLKKAEGVKIAVALTDGYENSSSAQWQDVINNAQELEVPMYIIGLGGVDVDTLRTMAEATKGQFFHTDNSESLIQIYKKISKQIQSFYAIEYKSPKAKKPTKEEDIRISFDINSIYLANYPDDPDVQAYLKKKKFNQDLHFYGKIAIYTLAGAGVISLLYIRRRRKKRKKMATQENNI